MNFKKLTLLFLLVSFSTIKAQKLELGKVSIEELQQKMHPKDTSAVAAILFKKGDVRFDYSVENGFEMKTEVKVRIKIYKKGGYEWANQTIGYYIGSGTKESLRFSDAVTYNLVNGKIEKTKLKSDGEFIEKVNKYWGRKKIALPNVKEGSVIEYSYLIVSDNIAEMRDWNFQYAIPVNYSEFKTSIPEYYTYKPNQKGFIYPKTTVEQERRTLNFSSIERSTGAGLSGAATTQSISRSQFEFQETKTLYVAENLPAMKDESFVNNIANYTSSVSHELSSIQEPNRPYRLFATNWESVTKKIYENEDFGAELKKTGYFEEDLKTVLIGKTTQEEKINAVFSFVKSKVKWNDFTGYSCDDGVKKAYKDGVGNVAEINLMLTAMLRFAEINANPVLISTRSNGIALFPSRTGFNYVIAGIETPEGLILLDATEKYGVPNVLPSRDLNWFGRLIRKDGTSTQVELSPTKLSNESTMMNLVLNDKGIVEGKLRRQFTNYNALSFRNKNIGTKKETYLENLENKNNAIEINEYVRDNELDLSKPIVETFDFKDTKDAEIINDKIYFSPLLFLATKENPFKQEVREYPVDFGFPFEDKYNISIEIPEGYVVESMPVAMNIASEDKTLGFKYLIANEGNKIQVAISSWVNTAIVPADFYEGIKNFFKQIVDKENEKIILKKI
jgi:Domain of Unknown Function with PDB structure (DUF3857)